jgi:hypothetical protein
VLAKNKTRTGRLWTYVRDDRPFGGQAPPAAAFFYSPDRGGEHPLTHLSGWAGVMQADAYAGSGELYVAARKPAPIIEAACWSHASRKFYELATLKKAPIAIKAVRRIDELFAIECEINGLSALTRLAKRQERSRPLTPGPSADAYLLCERDGNQTWDGRYRVRCMMLRPERLNRAGDRCCPSLGLEHYGTRRQSPQSPTLNAL